MNTNEPLLDESVDLPEMTFQDLGLPTSITKALERMKFTAPTPIQVQAVPPAMEGKDILGTAQTGTGKTAAFGIPLITRLLENKNSTALILTPTRELAMQIQGALRDLSQCTDLKTVLLIGGDSIYRQIGFLKRHPQIIIGTPGRINDHLVRGTLTLHDVRFLALDETDRMLDMGFSVQLERIAKFLTGKRQTVMFSATLPNEILKMAAKYLKNPVRISVGSTTTPIEKIDQKHIHVSETDKYMKLVDELEAREGSIVVFAKTKYGAEKLAKRLYQRRLSVDALHGGLRQNRREKIIQAFRKQKFRILVATDVASRGLDVPHVEHVINYDLPQVPEDYIHRIGRTARAGAEGSALSLLTSKDRGKWNAICRLLDPQFKGGKEDKNEGRFGQSRKSGRNRHRGGGKAKDRTQNQPGNQSSGGYSVRRPSINDDSRPKSNWKKPSQRGPKRRKAA